MSVKTIQTTTDAAVDSVSDIVNSIENICQISSTVAAAVDEQSAATQEIARNLVQTTNATQEVSTRIGRVSREAAGTGEHAADVKLISENVAQSIIK